MERKKFKQAVALQYDKEQELGAPRVVAVGQGVVAERIIEAAKAHGIPLREEKTLVAKMVHLPVGSEIPPELYDATAKILAFLYKLDQGKL